jgi:hypothetical protein
LPISTKRSPFLSQVSLSFFPRFFFPHPASWFSAQSDSRALIRWSGNSCLSSILLLPGFMTSSATTATTTSWLHVPTS